ncbi:MAG TPA: carboxypeptidase-like regulatory domain-containing protein, partial [Bacteroidales bacterium]|nr:carboxypeptidase-like regulatory domain-containing protein [Bacteroidales bacterium]
MATLLLLLVAIPVMGQGREVRGTVFEPDGVTPIFGATVVQKGTTNGTSTKNDGSFNITVSGQNPVLEIQFLGYMKEEITVGNQ